MLNHFPLSFHESLAAKGRNPGTCGRRDGAELLSLLKKLTSGGIEETREVKLQFIHLPSLAQFEFSILLMESVF